MDADYIIQYHFGHHFSGFVHDILYDVFLWHKYCN